MHSTRSSVRFSCFAGTALALIMIAASTASAAPQNSEAFVAPQPARDYSTPGSMPKPSATVDDGIRFRGSLPGSGDAPQPRHDATPLAPPPAPVRAEPAAAAKPVRPAAVKPISAPEVRAQ